MSEGTEERGQEQQRPTDREHSPSEKRRQRRAQRGERSTTRGPQARHACEDGCAGYGADGAVGVEDEEDGAAHERHRSEQRAPQVHADPEIGDAHQREHDRACRRTQAKGAHVEARRVHDGALEQLDLEAGLCAQEYPARRERALHTALCRALRGRAGAADWGRPTDRIRRGQGGRRGGGARGEVEHGPGGLDELGGVEVGRQAHKRRRRPGQLRGEHRACGHGHSAQSTVGCRELIRGDRGGNHCGMSRGRGDYERHERHKVGWLDEGRRAHDHRGLWARHVFHAPRERPLVGRRERVQRALRREQIGGREPLAALKPQGCRRAQDGRERSTCGWILKVHKRRVRAGRSAARASFVRFQGRPLGHRHTHAPKKAREALTTGNPVKKSKTRGVWKTERRRLVWSCEPFYRHVAHRAERRLWEIHVRKMSTSH